MIKAILYPKGNQRFSDIHNAYLRKDVTLDLEGEALELLYDMIGAMGEGMVEVIGEDATMIEFSGLVSFPGATMQHAHSDTDAPEINGSSSASQYTGFLYLNDVGEDQAALDVWPGTHQYFHYWDSKFSNVLLWDWDGDGKMPRVPAVRMAVPMGTMVWYSSLTFHRGENRCAKARPSFLPGRPLSQLLLHELVLFSLVSVWVH